MKRRSFFKWLTASSFLATGCAASHEEMLPPPAPKQAKATGLKFIVYQDAKKEWRWRLIARNGRVIADSAEGYDTKAACLNGILLVKASANAPVLTS